MNVEPSKLAQLVIAYYRQFGRHVPELALRHLDHGDVVARLQESLATGVPLSETGWGRRLPEFSPRGCIVGDLKCATPRKRTNGEWLQ
jgi:hypothetical protein